jgi:hypothetical protein
MSEIANILAELIMGFVFILQVVGFVVVGIAIAVLVFVFLVVTGMLD